METTSCELLDFGCHLNSFLDSIIAAFQWLWGVILDAMISVLLLIPVPTWAASGSFAVPEGVLWFASALQLQQGAAIMVSAWTIRFLIRRLPFVG